MHAIHVIIMIEQVCGYTFINWPSGLAHEMWRTARPRNPGLVSSSINGNVMLLLSTWEGNLSSKQTSIADTDENESRVYVDILLTYSYLTIKHEVTNRPQCKRLSNVLECGLV